MLSRLQFLTSTCRLTLINQRHLYFPPQGPVIGIDLGATNSCVAVMEDKKAKVIARIPSVVAFTNDGGRLVGEAAKLQAFINPQNTLYAFKRLIGRQYDDPEVQKMLKTVPYKIVKAKNGDARIEAHKKIYSPSQVTAYILRELKEMAENYLDKIVEEVVLTVPAYFDDSQTKVIEDAAKIAGISVLRTASDATITARAYDLDKADHKINIAVYDFGGTTFNIYILKNEKDFFDIKSFNGDAFLGGKDFDNRLVNYLIEVFKKEYGYDFTDDQMAIHFVSKAAEKAKCELSTTTEAEINLSSIIMNTAVEKFAQHYQFHESIGKRIGSIATVSALQSAAATNPLQKYMVHRITREKYETIVDDLIQRSTEICQKALDDAEIKATDIDEVLLIGGMSQMPLVQEHVKKIFGREPNKLINPEDVVAIGAVMFGTKIIEWQNKIY